MSKEVSSNMQPFVLLTRLTNEVIERLTGKNQNEQVLSNSHIIQPDQIKQEPIDDQYNYQENVNNEIFETETMTWYEQNSTVVKFETTTTTTVKTEAPDDYDDITLYYGNPPYSSCTGLVSGITLYKCDLCEREFNDYEQSIIHKALFHKNHKPYACELCDKRFSLRIHLNIHSAEHVNDFYSGRESTLPSDVQSSSRTNLALNSSTHNSMTFLHGSFNTGNSNIQKKKVCEKKEMSMISTQHCSSNSNILLLNYSNTKPFKCPNCLFASKSEKKFLDHHKDCNNYNKQFKCHLCPKAFLTQAAVNAHMRYHSKKRDKKIQSIKIKSEVKSQNDILAIKSATLITYKCKKCNRNFVSQRNLDIHLNQHKKQMKCKICQKQYFSEIAFEKHLLAHRNN